MTICNISPPPPPPPFIVTKTTVYYTGAEEDMGVKIGVKVIAMLAMQIQWNPSIVVSGPNKFAAIERWPDYTVEPV